MALALKSSKMIESAPVVFVSSPIATLHLHFPAGGAWINDKQRPKMPEAHFPAALDPLAAMGPSWVQRH